MRTDSAGLLTQCFLVCLRDYGIVETENRYLFWAKVLSEYSGGPKSLDIHAFEATPGTLRVAEANFGWNLFVQGFLMFLIFGPAWGTYEIVMTYLPSFGTISGPLPFFGGLLIGAAIAGMTFGSRRRIGRSILVGAFDHSRIVHSLSVLQIEATRTPQVWRLRCRTGGRELTVTVLGRHDRLREALELAGQPLNLVRR